MKSGKLILPMSILLTLLLSLSSCKKEEETNTSSEEADGRIPRFEIVFQNEEYGTSEFDTILSNGMLTVDATSAGNISYHFTAFNGLSEGVYDFGTNSSDNDFEFSYNDSGQLYYCHQCELHILEHDEEDDFVQLRISGTMRHVTISVFIDFIEAEISTYY